MKKILEIGNNGNQLVEVLHFLGLLKNGMDADQIAEIAKPYMINEKNLFDDNLWEDVFYRAYEMGYKLKY